MQATKNGIRPRANSTNSRNRVCHTRQGREWDKECNADCKQMSNMEQQNIKKTSDIGYGMKNKRKTRGNNKRQVLTNGNKIEEFITKEQRKQLGEMGAIWNIQPRIGSTNSKNR